MLTIDSVQFSFGRAPVIEDVSLMVERGAIVGVLGPNGSGKTTLLKLVSGALRPTAGHVRLDGQDVGAIGRRALARRLALVPQDTHLTFEYTALEIVLMGRYPSLGAFEIEGPEDLASAAEALDATGTGHLADRPFGTLSGGEKQRVIIASALAQLDDRSSGPDRRRASPLLLLDEPTASLDLRYQIETSALLRRLNQDRSVTVLLSTHDLRWAAALCSSLVLLSHGHVLAQGPPATVLTPARAGELYEIDAALAGPLLP